MKNVFRIPGLYIILILVVVGIVNIIANQGTDTVTLTYDQYRAKLAAGQIENVTVQPEGNTTYRIEGKLKGSRIKRSLSRRRC